MATKAEASAELGPSFDVVGDDLIVTHPTNPTLRLPLVLPLPVLDEWLAIDEDDWRREVEAIRDRIMPAAVRAEIDRIAETNGFFAIRVTREWGLGLSKLMGKALSYTSAGNHTETPSAQTSGPDSE